MFFWNNGNASELTFDSFRIPAADTVHELK